LNFSWLLLMAWRDSRRNRSRLLLFISSIILGIAALVAIYSLGDNLRSEVDRQAASLIGADLEVSANRALSPEGQRLVGSIPGARSEQRSFASMVLFPKNNGTRLVQVRALGGAYPYYGELETVPASAARSFRRGRQALVDKTLMLQYGVQTGDSVRLGTRTFVIAGVLNSAPGQTGLNASISPIVYIPLAELAATGLEQKGSRISYQFFYLLHKNIEAGKLVSSIGKQLENEGLNYDTIESQKEDTARSFRDLTEFLSLVGFMALLLGCIGVASAIHIYMREKIGAVAVLRCLGASARQTFLIYLIQIAGIGLIGSVLGAGLGLLIQQALPRVLQDFLPLTIEAVPSVPAILQGIGLGVVISVLFALLPLVAVRKISPLHTLRVSVQPAGHWKDGARWLVYALILAFILGFTRLQLGEWSEAAVFTAGVLVAFGILTAIAALLTWAVRRFFPVSWSYLWRQGLANLYRPHNQTRILIVAIGLGTAFICTLIFLQSILLNRVTLSASGNQPNMVLFDIQSGQRDSVLSLARRAGLPATNTVPIVNMRLERINDITGTDLQEDTTLPMQRWVFSREYRVTFRDSLTASEKIDEGKWTGTYANASAPVPVSLEQRFAERNGIGLGDTLTFNVQGSIIPTIVGSLRTVDWNRIQTNFLVVFPKGVLEEAPQFHVLLTHVPNTETSVRFQQSVVRQFPNVSIIDLGLVLSVLDEILDKIGFVVRFMAAFSIITGLVVLIASVLISKYQRIQESVLLRTLGANRRQIFAITALEYFFLGLLAAATGILLAGGAGWALARYTFETAFTPPLLPVAIVFLSVCLLTVVIGLFNIRSVLQRPPLEILRQEV
jgi:putative ABC transport system permease protein